MSAIKDNFKNWLLNQGLRKYTKTKRNSTVHNYVYRVDAICSKLKYDNWEELASNLFIAIEKEKGNNATALRKFNEFLFETDCWKAISSKYPQTRKNVLGLISVETDPNTGKKHLKETVAGKDYATPSETEGILRVSARTLKRWRKEGKDPRFSRIGGRVRYAFHDLEEFLNRRF